MTSSQKSKNWTITRVPSFVLYNTAFSRHQTPTREHLFWDKVNQVSLEDAALTLGESALFLPRRTVPILGQGPNQFKN
jgi:hypothetical protein